MSWFEFNERTNQQPVTEPEERLSFVSLVAPGTALPVEQQGGGQTPPNEMAPGRTGGRITDGLRAELLTLSVPIHINSLDSNNFGVRQRATNALREAIAADPHAVLPMLIAARTPPRNLEHSRRLQQLVDQFLDRSTTANGVTRDGLGRVTRMENLLADVTITWSRTNLGQIDTIRVVRDANPRQDGNRFVLNASELFERQPDGTYRVTFMNPLGGEPIPAGTAQAQDIRLTPRSLDISYTSNQGGRRLSSHPTRQ